MLTCVNNLGGSDDSDYTSDRSAAQQFQQQQQQQQQQQRLLQQAGEGAQYSPIRERERRVGPAADRRAADSAAAAPAAVASNSNQYRTWNAREAPSNGQFYRPAAPQQEYGAAVAFPTAGADYPRAPRAQNAAAPYYSHSPYSSSNQNQNQYVNYNGAAAANWPASRWPTADAGHMAPQRPTYSSCSVQQPNSHPAPVPFRGDYRGVGGNTPQWPLAQHQQHYDVSVNQPSAFAPPRPPPLQSAVLAASGAAADADEQDVPCAPRPHHPNRYVGAAPSIRGSGPSCVFAI